MNVGTFAAENLTRNELESIAREFMDEEEFEQYTDAELHGLVDAYLEIQL